MKLSKILLLLMVPGVACAEEIPITGGLQEQTNVILTLPLKTPIKNAEATIGAKAVPAQSTNDGKNVVILVEKIAAQEKLVVNVVAAKDPPKPKFAWKDVDGEKPILQYDGKNVLEYVRPKYDKEATPAKQPLRTNPTTKIYHHLYDTDGVTKLTNGANGQFSHHRGIFYGFNKVSYDGGASCDIWHCNSGESQEHLKTISHEAGNLFGKHVVEVAWNGKDGKPFAIETREVTVYNLPKARVVDFTSTLTTKLEKVKLDGDPQHAGFHFRANVLVEEKTKNETYFLRPSGLGEKGKEENWTNAKSPASTINRPWTAMSFVIGEKRYTTLYLDHSTNPKEARQSERSYGRVGTYFEHELTKDKPLKVRYRLWVQEGELTKDQCEQYSGAFTPAK